jgi:heterodisulfide reductase subunit A-like polyferredoxin/coenzyme F420-reducing hydrogenase delta subunit
MYLFLCDCRGEIDIPDDVRFDDDVEVIRISDLCSPEGSRLLREMAQKNGGKPFVFAGCSTQLAERFLTPYAPVVVNIREQGSFWGQPWSVLERRIRGAIARARLHQPIEYKRHQIMHRSALVIGGGVAGLEVARQLAASDIEVHLVEKGPFLGGMVAKLDRLYPRGTPNSHVLTPLINEVVANPRVHLYMNGELAELTGGIGAYKGVIHYRPIVESSALCAKAAEVCPVTVDDYGIERKAIYRSMGWPEGYQIDYEHCTQCGRCAEVCEGIEIEAEPDTVELDVGCVIVATGLIPYQVDDILTYGHGQYPNVYSTIEFERKIASGQIHPKSVLIIHCAGSRDENYLPYCSGICCLIGLKEAKLVKDRFSDCEVYVAYMDLRTHGLGEGLYETLRDNLGVTFVRGKPSEVLSRDGRLVVRTEDMLLGEDIEIEADAVVLSMGFVPDKELLAKLRLPVEQDFPYEIVESPLSVDANPQGIYLAGSAAGPRGVADTLINARSVAGQAASVLSKDEVISRTPVPLIEGEVCAEEHCKLCLSVCPYGALYQEAEETKVDELLCRGCGTCNPACPSGASQLEGWTDGEILAQVRESTSEGSIVCFLCRWSASPAADNAGYQRLGMPEEAYVIEVPCTGRVGNQMVLEAFQRGASGVLIGGCYPDACHYVSGNLKARRRISSLRDMVSQLGIPRDRLRVDWFGKEESQKLCQVLKEMAQVQLVT